MKIRYKRWRPVLLILLVFGLFWLGLDYAFYPWGAPQPGVSSGNKGENGLWLRYTWYFGKHSDADIDALATALQEHQIRDAYFHVRYIGKSGRLRYRYPEIARHLNARLHRQAPKVRSIAWIYVGNTRGIGSITDLSDATFRHKMVEEARYLVTDCGFDGVQWDYEICFDKDASLLALLDETRAALPANKKMSIATALWSPSVTCSLGYGWSENYFAQIARRCDQIVVMGYDSGIYLPRAYAWLMSEQVTHVCHAVSISGSPCRVLIGVPTYGKGGPSHHAHAENLSVAIRGVRAGYNHLSPTEQNIFAGIAPFADYTTDTNEWQQYQSQWLMQR